MGRFNIATEEEIRSGLTSDIYYLNTKDVLKAKGIDGRVTAEVTVGRLPEKWGWGVFCGLEEVLRLFEGLAVDIFALQEGTIFPPKDRRGFRLPLLSVVGKYCDFVSIETAAVGLLCQASGVATSAARVKLATKGRTVFAFGIRRMHPAIAPMLDRSAYIGGFDGVSGVAGAKLLGIEPTGTMPHPMILMFGDQKSAWKAFHEVVPRKVPRIALVDTICDEKFEALMAAETLGKELYGVRLDTPGSRRGDFLEIVREVRWELDARGHRGVKIFVSGGLDEGSVSRLAEGPVDGFGVGTSVSNAPTVDYSMDLVEVGGKPISKRGKYGGRKQAWRCKKCLSWEVALLTDGERQRKCGSCGAPMEPMLKKVVSEGKIKLPIPTPSEIRDYVLSQLGAHNLG
jgi:nicotinate phosphoribosyltransferase